MAVAHSAASESHTGTTGSTNQASFSWTHTQTGTPQGVLVFVHTISASDFISSVTYGGTALTRVSGGVAIDTAGEPGRTDLFFLGSGLASGNQTITVNRTNNATIMYASAATVTAATNTNVTGIVLLQGDGGLAVQSVTDGGAPTNSLRYAGAYSGLASPPPAGAGSTLLTSIDFGNYGCALVREITAGTGAGNVGFNNATTDDRAAVHVAVRELWNRSDTQTVGSFTLTGNAATLTVTSPKVIEPIVGAFTLTGNAADLRHNPDIEAGVGAFALTGNPAGTRHNVRLEGGTGTFALTGNPAGTRHNVQITGDLGKFFLPERNLQVWSQDFNNAAWSKGGSTITARAATSPIGDETASKFDEDNSNSTHQINDFVPVSGTTYTVSWYAKAAERTKTQFGGGGFSAQGFTAIFNLSTGTLDNNTGGKGSITSAGNGWYRCIVTFTASNTVELVTYVVNSAGQNTYQGVAGNGIYIWGYQVEEGSTLTDYDPTGAAAATPAGLKVASRIAAETGSFTLTGGNPQLNKGRTLAAETGAFTLASNGATLRRGYALTAQAGAFTATGQPATLRHNPRIEAATGAFALTGGSPALLRRRYLSGGAGTFIETGQPVTFRRTWAIQAGTGAFSLTGNPASLTELGAYEIDAIAGSFALSGQPATLAQSQTMPVTAGTFALSGQPATLRHNPAITAGRGQFTLSGQASTLTQGHALTASTGAFALTGQPASLGDTDVLDAAAGAFAFTGNPAGLNKSSALGGGTGAFTLTGNPASLSKQSAKQLAADAGDFAIAGNTATLSRSRLFAADRGQIALTGGAAAIVAKRALFANAGALALTGSPAALKATRLLAVSTGSFALTGQSANLTDTDELYPAVGTFALTGLGAELLKTGTARRRNVLIF